MDEDERTLVLVLIGLVLTGLLCGLLVLALTG